MLKGFYIAQNGRSFRTKIVIMMLAMVTIAVTIGCANSQTASSPAQASESKAPLTDTTIDFAGIIVPVSSQWEKELLDDPSADQAWRYHIDKSQSIRINLRKLNDPYEKSYGASYSSLSKLADEAMKQSGKKDYSLSEATVAGAVAVKVTTEEEDSTRAVPKIAVDQYAFFVGDDFYNISFAKSIDSDCDIASLENEVVSNITKNTKDALEPTEISITFSDKENSSWYAFDYTVKNTTADDLKIAGVGVDYLDADDNIVDSLSVSSQSGAAITVGGGKTAKFKFNANYADNVAKVRLVSYRSSKDGSISDAANVAIINPIAINMPEVPDQLF